MDHLEIVDRCQPTVEKTALALDPSMSAGDELRATR
jgi:hypothetical protein